MTCYLARKACHRARHCDNVTWSCHHSQVSKIITLVDLAEDNDARKTRLGISGYSRVENKDSCGYLAGWEGSMCEMTVGHTHGSCAISGRRHIVMRFFDQHDEVNVAQR